MAQNEYDDQEQQSPEATAVEEARSESPEEMKSNILRFERESTSIEHGLTESKPESEDDTDYSDPAVQRELLEQGQRLLAESGHTARREAPSEEARELMEAATERELEDGGYETEAGLRHAQRDRQSFLDLVRAAVEASRHATC